jgi:hypothetical protein
MRENARDLELAVARASWVGGWRSACLVPNLLQAYGIYVLDSAS